MSRLRYPVRYHTYRSILTPDFLVKICLLIKLYFFICLCLLWASYQQIDQDLFLFLLFDLHVR